MGRFGLGLGLGLSRRGGGGAPADSIAPVANWRLPISAAYSSTGNSALVAALIGSETTKARPSFSTVAATAQTVAVKVGAIAAPGGIMTFIANATNDDEGNDRQTVTVAPAYSDDSTNGSDGTWTALTYAQVAPDAWIEHRRQYVDLPAGPANRWIRLVITTSANATVSPLWHQLSATGRNDAYGIVGCSLSRRGLMSKTLETEIIRQFPASDPLVFNYALGGTKSGVLRDHPAAMQAAYSHIYSYIYIGNLFANDVGDNSPLVPGGGANILRGNADAIITGFGDKLVFPIREEYEALSGVTPTDPDDGILPFNVLAKDPSTLANTPDAWDATYNIPRIDQYAVGTFFRYALADGVHFNRWDIFRQEFARVLGGRIYNGAWPPTYAEYFVGKLETERLYHYKKDALNVVYGLPDTPAKTALLARIAAVTGTMNPTRLKVKHGPTANAPVGWENTSATTLGGGIAIIYSEDAWPSPFGVALTAAVSGAFANGAQGAAGGALFPDNVLISYIRDTTDTSFGVKYTGFISGETATVKAIGSVTGSGSRLQDMTIGAETDSINALGNVAAYAEFDNVVPTAGEIAMTIARGSGNVTGIYLNAAILEINGP